MKLVVTGASGFIGKPLIEALAGHGYAGIATGRTPPHDVPSAWTSLPRSELLRSTDQADNFDAIIHLEVKHHVSRPKPNDLKEFDEVNVEGTKSWLAFAARQRIKRFVFVSSVKAVEQRAGVFYEDANLETSDPYGRSKALAESHVRQWAAEASERHAVILRFSPVYGPGNEANFASFARQVIEGKPCLIAAGEARKSILSRLNAVAAIEHTLLKSSPGCETYNVSDPCCMSMAELARHIANAAKAPAPRRVPWLIAVFGAKLGDTVEFLTRTEFLLNTRKLRTLTNDSIFPAQKLTKAGYSPLQTTEEGIEEMVEWIIEQRRQSFH